MATGFSAVTYALCKKSTSAAIASLKELIDQLSEGMHFRGSVPTESDLPSNPELGDLYVIEDTGNKAVWDGSKWVIFEENYYTKQEVDTKLEDLATIQALQNEIDRAIASENSIRSSIPTKTSQLINDSGFLTEQDISGKADKTYVDNQLQLKQDKLTAGDHIIINNSTISANLDGYATKQWVEDKHYLTEHQSLDNYYTKSQVYNKTETTSLLDNIDDELNRKQDQLIAGENIEITSDAQGNPVISAIGGSSGTIGRNFTTDITVGHLEAGTEIHANDTIADILYRILCAEVPGTTINVYYGVSDNIPSNITGLATTVVEKSDLTNEQIIEFPAANNQYCVIATDKDVELLSWKVMGFDYPISFGLIPHNKYNIYYINEPDPTIFDDGRITAPATNYRFKFKEIN